MTTRRRLGRSDLLVTAVGMGCWPITGITSLDVHEEASLATLRQAFDAGINFFDTAHCYGYNGESERMVARVLGPHRHEIVVATKAGIVWNDRKQQRDGSPAAIHRHCDESLRRLEREQVDLLYLHAPDPAVPITESAGAFLELLQAGKTRAVGLSNATVEQLEAFHRVCPLTAYQPHYNMLQREIEQSQLPWCIAHEVAVVVYWPLMKGLLAGKLARDHQFSPQDGRAKYPMFQGDEWHKNQDFLDDLKQIARRRGVSVSQLVLAWTIAQPGITVALCGAKRPDQILENAASLDCPLGPDTLSEIAAAIARRGSPVSRGAVS